MYNSDGMGWNGNQQQQNPIMPQPLRPLYSMNNTPRYEVIKVNGEAGARNFRMGPNSNALLLDNTAAIVWYAQTDGTGYLTVTPFDITPHQAPKPVDMNDLSARVTKLEEIMANVQQQSNFGTSKQSKKQRQQQQQPEPGGFTDANESTGNSTI